MDLRAITSKRPDWKYTKDWQALRLQPERDHGGNSTFSAQCAGQLLKIPCRAQGERRMGRFGRLGVTLLAAFPFGCLLVGSRSLHPEVSSEGFETHTP